MSFFNSYLAVPRPILHHYREDSFTNPMSITAFPQLWPEGHQKPYSKIGYLSPAKRLVGMDPGTFKF